MGHTVQVRVPVSCRHRVKVGTDCIDGRGPDRPPPTRRWGKAGARQPGTQSGPTSAAPAARQGDIQRISPTPPRVLTSTSSSGLASLHMHGHSCIIGCGNGTGGDDTAISSQARDDTGRLVHSSDVLLQWKHRRRGWRRTGDGGHELLLLRAWWPPEGPMRRQQSGPERLPQRCSGQTVRSPGRCSPGRVVDAAGGSRGRPLPAHLPQPAARVADRQHSRCAVPLLSHPTRNE